MRYEFESNLKNLKPHKCCKNFGNIHRLTTVVESCFAKVSALVSTTLLKKVLVIVVFRALLRDCSSPACHKCSFF